MLMVYFLVLAEVTPEDSKTEYSETEESEQGEQSGISVARDGFSGISSPRFVPFSYHVIKNPLINFMDYQNCECRSVLLSQ